MIVQIGGDYGDPKASDYFFPFQKKFNDLFKTHISGEYFQTLGKLSIVFRVSGKVTDFGSEGPERLKYLKKTRNLQLTWYSLRFSGGIKIASLLGQT